ncbi:phage holin family protein [Rothia sp. LK2588]|uniref:phage holin family protein n=1 Tax=Rothia sp. LK2588 TaxID=3114369 RepID=UPI0034CE8D3C
MNEHVNPGPESVRADEFYERRTPTSGIKSAFVGLKSSVTNTADAAKVLTRLTPKQLKDEVQLAKLEMVDKGKSMGKGAAVGAVAAIFALCMLIALISAAILGLGKIMEAWLAALLVALLFLILAAICGLVAMKMIKKQLPLKPESAIFGILYDLGVLKKGSDMTAARVKREQEEKEAKKAEQKKAKEEAAKREEKENEHDGAATSEERLKLRTEQRREHLKSLRDDIDTYSNTAKRDANGLVGAAKTSASATPNHLADRGRVLGKNATNPELLKARWGSFATLAASVSAFFVFLGKLIRR